MVGTSVVLIIDAYRQTGDVVGSVCTFSKLSAIGQSTLLTTAVRVKVFVEHNDQKDHYQQYKIMTIIETNFLSIEKIFNKTIFMLYCVEECKT